MLSLLNNSTLNVVATGGTAVSALTIAHVRPVPGSYNLWSDPKVFALLYVTILCLSMSINILTMPGTGMFPRVRRALRYGAIQTAMIRMCGKHRRTHGWGGAKAVINFINN